MPPARSAMWLGTIPLGLLAVAALFAIPRWLPASSVSLPDIGHAQQQPPASSIATKPREWPRCPECGEIESVRQVVRSDGTGGRTRSEVDAGAPGVASKSAIVATDDGLTAYEVTVRHRDGSTTTFGATSSRHWRVGSRVNVIGMPEATSP